MQGKKEETVIVDTEIKEKINYAFILFNRIDAINKAFDKGDKYMVKGTLNTCFANISPYLDKDTKTRLNKKRKALNEIDDKDSIVKLQKELFLMP